jgi:hypothetical protein
MLCGGDPAIGRSWGETFEKRSFLFKFKEGDPALAGLTTGIH